jgi:hypothetical protein
MVLWIACPFKFCAPYPLDEGPGCFESQCFEGGPCMRPIITGLKIGASPAGRRNKERGKRKGKRGEKRERGRKKAKMAGAPAGGSR